MWKDEYKTALVAGMNDENGFERAKSIKSQNIPQHLYKYQRCEGYSLASLEKDELWIATASNFNDIYECALFFDWDAMLRNGDAHGYLNDAPEMVRSVQQLCEQINKDPHNARAYLTEHLHRLDIPSQIYAETIRCFDSIVNPATLGRLADLTSASEEIEKIVRNTNLHSPQSVQSQVKVSSLSERVDSILMWAHYAESNQGFCVEYDINTLTKYRENLFPVVYTDEPLILTEPGVKSHWKHSPFLATLAATHKAADWSYEREWRILLINDWNNPDCGFRPAETAGHVLNNIRPSAIYLGARIKPPNQQKLMNIAKSKGIPVFKMNLAPFSFQLKATTLPT